MPSRLITPTFVALAVATLVFYVASGMVVTAAPVFGGVGLGLPKALVGVAIAIFSVAAIISRPVVGWSTDRYGRRPALLIGGIVTIAGLLLHLLATDVWLFIAARCLLGAGEAFWLVAALSAAADLAPEGRRGESLSFLSLTLYLGLAIGPVIEETILTSTGSFPIVWTVTAAVAAGSLALAWFVPETAPPTRSPTAAPGGAPVQQQIRAQNPTITVGNLTTVLGGYYKPFVTLRNALGNLWNDQSLTFAVANQNIATVDASEFVRNQGANPQTNADGEVRRRQ